MKTLQDSLNQFTAMGIDIRKVVYNSVTAKAWLYSSTSPLATPETDVSAVSEDEARLFSKRNGLIFELDS